MDIEAQLFLGFRPSCDEPEIFTSPPSPEDREHFQLCLHIILDGVRRQGPPNRSLTHLYAEPRACETKSETLGEGVLGLCTVPAASEYDSPSVEPCLA